jgi:cysteinyl-tRNA synthetase
LRKIILHHSQAFQDRRKMYLTNTLTGEKELFEPGNPDTVRLVTCGPSIYDRPHIGNYSTFLFEDILHRYLEYSGYTVNRLINFTDVEDKSIAKAEEKNVTIEELTRPVEKAFFAEAGQLSIKLPDSIPRSSTSVKQAVVLIQKLLEKGIAYRHEGDVFYRPTKFKGFGKLFGLDMYEWPKKPKRFHKDTYPGRRWNRGDFILWHGYKGDHAEHFYWDTELGKGRPAWNVQDAAMITENMGYEADICCGGVDNLYRHHDYNIAVIEGVSGKEFCHFWLHAEHVLLNGKKMSKSKGNIVYPEAIYEKGYTPRDLRFYLISGHYRRKKNLRMESFEKTSSRLHRIREMVQTLFTAADRNAKSADTVEGLIEALKADFEIHMNNDLSVEPAIDALQEKIVMLNTYHADGNLNEEDQRRIEKALQDIDGVLKILFV